MENSLNEKTEKKIIFISSFIFRLVDSFVPLKVNYHLLTPTFFLFPQRWKSVDFSKRSKWRFIQTRQENSFLLSMFLLLARVLSYCHCGSRTTFASVCVNIFLWIPSYNHLIICVPLRSISSQFFDLLFIFFDVCRTKNCSFANHFGCWNFFDVEKPTKRKKKVSKNEEKQKQRLQINLLSMHGF